VRLRGTEPRPTEPRLQNRSRPMASVGSHTRECKPDRRQILPVQRAQTIEYDSPLIPLTHVAPNRFSRPHPPRGPKHRLRALVVHRAVPCRSGWRSVRVARGRLRRSPARRRFPLRDRARQGPPTPLKHHSVSGRLQKAKFPPPQKICSQRSPKPYAARLALSAFAKTEAPLPRRAGSGRD
jgi:hypothetical protein